MTDMIGMQAETLRCIRSCGAEATPSSFRHRPRDTIQITASMMAVLLRLSQTCWSMGMVDTPTAIVKLLPLLVEEPLERIDHFPQLPAARAAPAGNGVVRGDDAVQLHRRILPAPRQQTLAQVEDAERGLVVVESRKVLVPRLQPIDATHDRVSSRSGGYRLL